MAGLTASGALIAGAATWRSSYKEILREFPSSQNQMLQTLNRFHDKIGIFPRRLDYEDVQDFSECLNTHLPDSFESVIFPYIRSDFTTALVSNELNSYAVSLTPNKAESGKWTPKDLKAARFCNRVLGYSLTVNIESVGEENSRPNLSKIFPRHDSTKPSQIPRPRLEDMPSSGNDWLRKFNL